MVHPHTDTKAKRASPRPEMLAAMTDRHVLATMSAATSPISRAEVATLAALSKPAVGASVGRLVERGVLREVGTRDGRRGGVATLYEVNARHGQSISVAIDNDAVALESRDLRGHVVASIRESVHPALGVEAVRTAANQLIAAAKQLNDAPIIAAGVSISDPVHPATQRPVPLPKSVFPALALKPDTDLTVDADTRVLVDNDVNWSTVGEHHQGALRGRDDFLYIHLGDGLGAGLFLNGRLYRGSRGLAGEIGYWRMRVQSDADLTESLVALGLGKPGGHGFDLRSATELFARTSSDGDRSTAIALLGRAVANLLVALDPEAITFGGQLSRVPGLVDSLIASLTAMSVDIPPHTISAMTPLRGAALGAHQTALEAVGIPATGIEMVE